MDLRHQGLPDALLQAHRLAHHGAASSGNVLTVRFFVQLSRSEETPESSPS
jgi:hypothetical protein